VETLGKKSARSARLTFCGSELQFILRPCLWQGPKGSDINSRPRSGLPFAVPFPRVFELLAPTCPESLPAAGSKGPGTIRRRELPPLSLHLRYRNDYVSIGRAPIPPTRGGHMAYAACASITCAPAPLLSPLRASRLQDRSASLTLHSFTLRACQWQARRAYPEQRACHRQDRRVSSTFHCHFLIGSTAIKNSRIPLKQHAMFFSNRPRIACLRARLSRVLHSTNHQPRRTTRAFLIATQILEIELTRSQQTRKLFLIATFYGCLANASHLASFYFSRSVPNGAMRAVTFVRKNSPAFREAHISQHFDGRGPAALPHFCANIPKSNTFAHQRLSPRLRTNAQVTVE